MVRESKAATDLDEPDPPMLHRMGGRLRAERERLRLSVAEAAKLMGIQEEALLEWEASSGGRSASGLTLLSHAGADVLFIVTGIRNEVGKADGRSPSDRFRGALEQLPADERQRLLLAFITEELKYVRAR